MHTSNTLHTQGLQDYLSTTTAEVKAQAESMKLLLLVKLSSPSIASTKWDARTNTNLQQTLQIK